MNIFAAATIANIFGGATILFASLYAVRNPDIPKSIIGKHVDGLGEATKIVPNFLIRSFKSSRRNAYFAFATSLMAFVTIWGSSAGVNGAAMVPVTLLLWFFFINPFEDVSFFDSEDTHSQMKAFIALVACGSINFFGCIINLVAGNYASVLVSAFTLLLIIFTPLFVAYEKPSVVSMNTIGDYS